MGVILLRFIGSFLVLMSFFSFGAAAGIRSKSKTPLQPPFPSLLDLGLILICWLATISAYKSGYQPVLATLAGAVAVFFAGFILHLLLMLSPGHESTVKPGSARIPVPGIQSSNRQVIAIVQPRWRLYFRQAGGFQSRLLLSLFYYVVLLPFGVLVGMMGDPLGLKAPPGDSFWKSRNADSQKLEDARGQS
jgi:hypothetical protein